MKIQKLKFSVYLLSILLLSSCTRYSTAPDYEFRVSNGYKSGNNVFFLLNVTKIYKNIGVMSEISVETKIMGASFQAFHNLA